jgi:hypothetical protein
MLGYHFTTDTLRDGRPIPPIGEWLEHTGPIVPCESGLHASEHPFDALQFAPGWMLHHVELEGGLVPHGDPVDKWVGRRRRILASIDATDLLRAFARWCVLQVIDQWDAPAVVREYLETGDESKREAARVAAWDARVAAGDARDAARDAKNAARVTARVAARDAAEAAGDARDAAGDARDAARDAAWVTAGVAAWDARNAALVTAGDARVAARVAARDAQRDQFAAMVEAAFAKETP